MVTTTQFLSTPSARRATYHNFAYLSRGFYFYPRPPRGGRPASGNVQPRHLIISIHALREEGDADLLRKDRYLVDFYPRPPRGGRLGCFFIGTPPLQFLSTPSARRATLTSSDRVCRKVISIHALREEGDCWHSGKTSALRRFLSTPSARRATPCSLPACFW